jgi:hypothetical protein
MMNRNDILKRMNTALSELHRCHNELAAMESAAEHKTDLEHYLDVLAQEMSGLHPVHKTASVDATGRALYEIVSRSLNPAVQMDHIQNHHKWRCTYDWPTRPPQMVTQLVKWIREEALNPIPSDAEGEELLKGSPKVGIAKLTKREQEAEELRREQGW